MSRADEAALTRRQRPVRQYRSSIIVKVYLNCAVEILLLYKVASMAALHQAAAQV